MELTKRIIGLANQIIEAVDLGNIEEPQAPQAALTVTVREWEDAEPHRRRRSRESGIPQAGSPGEEAFALHCRAEKLTLEREFIFHSTRKWRFDFAIPSRHIAIEIEGRGRHQSFGGFESDAKKYNAAAKLGWRVLRYTPAMVMRGDAINDVLEILHA